MTLDLLFVVTFRGVNRPEVETHGPQQVEPEPHAGAITQIDLALVGRNAPDDVAVDQIEMRIRRAERAACEL
ncbi:hypothetical protein GCM10007858_44770 [Bradyrhizobium liaoningense]|nr:hypothetical protein GCM10007858_44770 [Bradyrhizobium liaoningense]